MKSTIYLGLLMLVTFSCGVSNSGGARKMSDQRMVNQGYSIQKESSRTTAISQQEIEDKDHGMTMADILSRVPGLSVTGSGRNLSIQVRGRKSFTQSEEPLFVVNGQILGNGFQSVDFIDPLMVDRISVLKDGASTSEYGHRGANGVILIQLKKGI